MIDLFIKIRVLDLIDIFLVAFLMYQIYMIIRGTIAINIFIAIFALYLLWLLVKAFDMHLLSSILGQIIGLYAAFEAIEAAADISPAMLAGGLKVSLITTIYGLLIFVISLLIRLATKPRIRQN